MTVALLETWLGAQSHGDGDDHRPSSRSAGGVPRQTSEGDDDDQTLVARIRAGDSLAFDTLARRHIATLVRFASALVGDRDVAEDVVQTILARLWERRVTLVPTGSVVAYLCAAARNQALDVRRRDGARQRAAALVGTTLSATLPVPDGGDAREAIVALRAAFFTLPEHYRAVLQLRYGQRFGYVEIAGALALTPKGAERLLARAMAALRRELGAE